MQPGQPTGSIAVPVADVGEPLGEEVLVTADVADDLSNDALPYVHPGSQGLKDRNSILLKLPIVGTVLETFGPKCTFALGISYFFQRGIANNILAYSKYAMFVERFGANGMRYQRLANIAGLGWSIKAMTAVFADGFAFMHYTKRWYIAICTVMGFAFSLGLGLLPAKESSADIGGGFLFLANWCIANYDILTEGQYSRLMRNNASSGPSLVSMLYWTIMAGGVIAAVAQGPLSDQGRPQVGLFIAAGAQIICIPLFILNWYGEDKNKEERVEDAQRNHKQMLDEARRYAVEHGDTESALVPKDLHPERTKEDNDSEDGDKPDAIAAMGNADASLEMQYEEPRVSELCGGVIEMNKDIFTKQWKMVCYCAVMTVGVVVMTVVTILGNTWDLLYACIAVSVVCIGLSFVALPMTIAKGNVYIFMNQVVYLQLPGALDSFYMASEACVPDGPNFTFTFYNTIAAIIGNLGGMVGVIMFTYVFSKHTFATAMIVATTIQIIASIFDIIIVERWNVYIGIPDHAMYILGDQIVYQACYYLTYMPMVIMLSRLCPRGSESIVFAIVAGFGNFGAALSNTIGSLLMELVWPVATTVPCDFSNVPWLILTGHFGTPLINIPLALILLPHARMCDDLDLDGHTIRKAVADKKKAKENHNESTVGEPTYENSRE